MVQSPPAGLQKTGGYMALEETAAWLSLPGRGLLSVTGPDRLRFLNAMVTTDLRKLELGAGCYTLLLDARGRVISDSTVHAMEGRYLLDSEGTNQERLFAHLDRYLIADDVEIENHTYRYSCIGVEGPGAETALQDLGIPQPQAADGALWRDGGLVARTSLTGASGFRLFFAPEKRAALLRALGKAEVVPATDDDVRVIRLENGKPRWGEEITSRYLGPEIGLTEAIAQSKGCYLGQEVVERIRSRGLLGRLLVPIRVSTTLAIPAGEQLLEGKRRVGEAVTTAFSPRFSEVVGLAYIQTGFLNGEHRIVCESSGAVVNIHAGITGEEIG